MKRACVKSMQEPLWPRLSGLITDTLGSPRWRERFTCLMLRLTVQSDPLLSISLPSPRLCGLNCLSPALTLMLKLSDADVYTVWLNCCCSLRVSSRRARPHWQLLRFTFMIWRRTQYIWPCKPCKWPHVATFPRQRQRDARAINNLRTWRKWKCWLVVFLKCDKLRARAPMCMSKRNVWQARTTPSHTHTSTLTYILYR